MKKGVIAIIVVIGAVLLISTGLYVNNSIKNKSLNVLKDLSGSLYSTASGGTTTQTSVCAAHNTPYGCDPNAILNNGCPRYPCCWDSCKVSPSTGKTWCMYTDLEDGMAGMMNHGCDYPDKACVKSVCISNCATCDIKDSSGNIIKDSYGNPEKRCGAYKDPICKKILHCPNTCDSSKGYMCGTTIDGSNNGICIKKLCSAGCGNSVGKASGDSYCSTDPLLPDNPPVVCQYSTNYYTCTTDGFCIPDHFTGSVTGTVTSYFTLKCPGAEPGFTICNSDQICVNNTEQQYDSNHVLFNPPIYANTASCVLKSGCSGKVCGPGATIHLGTSDQKVEQCGSCPEPCSTCSSDGTKCISKTSSCGTYNGKSVCTCKDTSCIPVNPTDYLDYKKGCPTGKTKLLTSQCGEVCI